MLSGNEVQSLELLAQIEFVDNIAEQNEPVNEIIDEFGDSGEYNSEAAGSFSRELESDVLEKLNMLHQD